MKSTSRITSILKSSSLDSPIVNVENFNLSVLNLTTNLEFDLPNNIRLGHLVEKVVSQLIKLSSNYKVIYENIQIIEDKTTIGELDFIIQNVLTQQVIHMELAYKFYLFDPNISSESINNWIGPNRNDSLQEKLAKLKRKQFPLLYHKAAKSIFSDIKTDEVSQALCLLVSLFIPYQYKESFTSIYKNAIKGYYLDFETFINLDNSEKTYYLPSKKEWGMEPSENEIWTGFTDIEKYIHTSIKEKQAPLCWQKYKDSYSVFFIVWW